LGRVNGDSLHKAKVEYYSEPNCIVAKIKFIAPHDVHSINTIYYPVMKVDWFRDTVFSEGQTSNFKIIDSTTIECYWGFQTPIPEIIFYCSAFNLWNKSGKCESLIIEKDFPWTAFKVECGILGKYKITNLDTIPDSLEKIQQVRNSYKGAWRFLNDGSRAPLRHYLAFGLVEDARLDAKITIGELEIVPISLVNHGNISSTLHEMLLSHFPTDLKVELPNFSAEVPTPQDGIIIKHYLMSNVEPVKLLSVLEDEIYSSLVADYGFFTNQLPKLFGTCLLERKTGQLFSVFHRRPEHKGPRDFSSTTAMAMERHGILKLQQPWLKMLTRLYQDSKLSTDQATKIIKLWNILEIVSKQLIGKKCVLYQIDGTTPIASPRGKNIEVGSGGWKPIYELMRQSISENYPFKNCMFQTSIRVRFDRDIEPSKNNQDSLVSYELKFFVEMLYGMRCLFAHRGSFSGHPPGTEFKPPEDLAIKNISLDLLHEYIWALDSLTKMIISMLLKKNISEPDYKYLYNDIDSNLARILYGIHPNNYKELTADEKKAVFLEGDFFLDVPFDPQKIV